MLALWFVRTADVRAAHQQQSCDAVLEPHERTDVQTHVFEKHRHEYRVTRALCRAVLGRHLGASPATLRFRRNRYGRPELDPPSPTVFTSFERSELGRLPVELQRARAVHLWTMKEAYMKAHGMGLSVPVQSFEVDFSDGAPVLRFLPPLDDRPSRWKLEAQQVEDHVLSICREAGPRGAMQVELHRANFAELLSGFGA